MAMSESMEAAKVESDETNRLRVIEKNKMVADAFEVDTTATTASENRGASKEARQREKLKRMLSQALGGDDLSTAADNDDFDDFDDYRSGWKRAYFRLGTAMEKITENRVFVNGVTAAILLSGA